ncbi:hypothetical protein LTR78_010762 [Recurvomyces mirabilis]|uniref:Uncharacterized protein n=1 Tax=Recurvomyces mirabilis TaxID=574656 RepID=A0AAE0WG27_9PEZI|nr:hypothetical protein LTR78_010762 [Recurvomyces mirabilis]
MEDAFKARFSDEQSTGKKRYSAEELGTIGRICHGRLPPASIVQAMFMYELQRQADNEKLFDSMIFQLARGDGVTYPEVERLSAVEDEIKMLKLQWNAKQNAKVELCKRQLDAHEDHFSMLTTKFDDIKAIQERLSRQNGYLQQLAKTVEACEQKTTTMDGEIDNELFNAMMIGLHQHDKDLDTIFAERDALLEQLQTSNNRITKLEDLVRALTGNMSPSNSASPTMTQQLPVHTASGQTINLSVPKGASIGNNTRENRAPSGIRSFTPGEQWAA